MSDSRDDAGIADTEDMMLARQLVSLALWLFLLALMGRLVLDWIQMLARDWRPRGPILVVAEGLYSVTDPPLRAIRKVIPPLRLGGVSLDLAFMVLILAVYTAMRLL